MAGNDRKKKKISPAYGSGGRGGGVVVFVFQGIIRGPSEVDHIRAWRVVEGTPGDDELYNLALLHRTCNGIKRNRLTLEELRRYNADNGLLYVDTVGELVDLFEATRFAAQEISRRAVGVGTQ